MSHHFHVDHIVSIQSYEDPCTPCVYWVLALLIATSFRTSTDSIPRLSCGRKWLRKGMVVDDLTICVDTLLAAKVVTPLGNVWQQPSEAQVAQRLETLVPLQLGNQYRCITPAFSGSPRWEGVNMAT